MFLKKILEPLHIIFDIHADVQQSPTKPLHLSLIQFAYKTQNQ